MAEGDSAEKDDECTWLTKKPEWAPLEPDLGEGFPPCSHVPGCTAQISDLDTATSLVLATEEEGHMR